ncbi:aspartate/glutamate racemase family protein [Aquimarina mytili]|uniref:Aspartate/glutamate racemase family protein n=1 Tax=Aquimarina mytili TaxID=874423 RepID=A0A936ZV44_9FLAO|nr:amino acid racemase [Aquimarina mytili]MBL0686159.1 aspartate/glutamate racemase family protein [Aquimarina mytili]
MMTLEQKNIIGIIGGMGPQAGLDLFKNVLHNTPATIDQNHLSTILMSFPKEIADRTSFLEGQVLENPAYSIVRIIEKLEFAGANIIGMACNTSHCPEILNVIENELKESDSKVKLINMPIETCKYLKKNYKKFSKIGLMTTNGTYKTGLYKNLLEEYNFTPIIPNFHFQDTVINKMIYDRDFGIKASINSDHPELVLLINEAISFFKQRKVDAIVLGCTELPLVFKKKCIKDISFIDPANILAKALVREAKQNVGSLANILYT